MKTITGNLLDLFDAGVFDTIVHGCNCQHNMGGGIAYQIAQRYPLAIRADLLSDQNRLGGCSFAIFEDGRTIVNAYTQVLPGADARLVGVAKVFRLLKDHHRLQGAVGIPMIGAGIGGLEWSDVELILDRLDLPNVTVVEFG